MRRVPFTRPTLGAAIEMLEAQGHNQLNKVILRLGLEGEITSDPSLSVAKKADRLGRAVLQRTD